MKSRASLHAVEPTTEPPIEEEGLGDCRKSGTIAVAGLGRCGSSLTMQLLDAAGFPTVGSFPAYEDDDHLAEMAWHPSFGGRAFKFIDPHRWHALPPTIDLLIWLDRDVGEQAASQIKFALFFQSGGRITTGTRQQRREMAGLLRRDRERARKVLDAVKVGRRIDLTFESLLCDPPLALKATELRADWDAGRIIPRAPTCFPGMLEMQLMGLAA